MSGTTPTASPLDVELSRIWQNTPAQGDPTGKQFAIAFGHAVLAQITTPLTTGWRPIDTAPRDNKRPLYLAKFDEQGQLRHLDFDGAWEFESESWEQAYLSDGYYWMSANGIEEPTHWAYQDEPLPATLKEGTT